jgi:hypothetical protein
VIFFIFLFFNFLSARSHEFEQKGIRSMVYIGNKITGIALVSFIILLVMPFVFKSVPWYLSLIGVVARYVITFFAIASVNNTLNRYRKEQISLYEYFERDSQQREIEKVLGIKK